MTADTAAPKPKTVKGQLAQEIARWRQEKFAEMDANLTMLVGIRDDDKAKPKDRIEAAKAIAKMLGVAPERTATTPTAPTRGDSADDGPPPPPMTEQQRSALDAYLVGMTGPKN